MIGSTYTTRASEAHAPRGGSWAAVATSASLHVAVMALLAALARIAPAPTLPHERRPMTFVMMTAPVPPVPHEPPPALTIPVSAVPERPTPIVVAAPDAPPAAPKPLARSEPGPAPPEPVRPAPPTVAPPVPVRTPPVAVGLFADSAPTVHEAKPADVVRAAGFDAPSPTARSGETKSAAAVGAFDQSMAGAPGRVARAGAPIASAGFGSSRAETSGDLKPAVEVRPSGFDAVRPAPAPALRATAPERVEVPVEILFKPAPTYTDEARALKIEGDVLLSVEFGATGAITVLQIVRGLGHGLDEAAARAAAEIRFKPAQSGGRPINFRTTVHIVFRLA